MTVKQKGVERLFGCHVSAAGGLHKAIENGVALGVNTIQLHASPPQQWNREPFADGKEDQFLQERRDSGIKRVFFHAIYLINLATVDDEKYVLSQNSLKFCLDLISRVKGDGVIVHVGSLKDHDRDNDGYQRVVEAVNHVLAATPEDSRLLMEVSAGSGRIIGAQTDELARIYEKVELKDRLGFALDSQHMWASGYDFRENLPGIVKEVKKNFGLQKVWAIHLNDSKTELGSRRDRHENIGSGLIGRAALKEFLNHASFKKVPYILETPALKTLKTAAKEVAKVKRMLG